MAAMELTNLLTKKGNSETDYTKSAVLAYNKLKVPKQYLFTSLAVAGFLSVILTVYRKKLLTCAF